jgi:hypothetical protein
VIISLEVWLKCRKQRTRLISITEQGYKFNSEVKDDEREYVKSLVKFLSAFYYQQDVLFA